MPQLTVTVNDRTSALIGRDAILARLRKLDDANEQALDAAARTATAVTRRSFTYRRDIAPPRPGRSSTGGKMVDHLQWGRPSGSPDTVAFQKSRADREVPHWIIQEIGSGETATASQGPDLPSLTFSVRSQIGRRISTNLVFATGGQYSEPGASRHEQLFRAEKISGVPLGAAHGRKSGLRITRNIEGQHFVQKGGLAGFRQYETSLLAAARQVFGKRTP